MQIKQENIIKWKKYKTKDLPLLLALFFVALYSSLFFLLMRAQLIIVL